MGYNGYTEKKKESNKKYMEKLKRISIWLSEDEKARIEQKAKEKGQSVNQYMKELALK